MLRDARQVLDSHLRPSGAGTRWKAPLVPLELLDTSQRHQRHDVLMPKVTSPFTVLCYRYAPEKLLRNPFTTTSGVGEDMGSGQASPWPSTICELSCKEIG